MKIGRVAGTVVSTICSPDFEGRRLLTFDLLDLSGKTTGKDLIAVDAVGAGAVGSAARRTTAGTLEAVSWWREYFGPPTHCMCRMGAAIAVSLLTALLSGWCR